LRDDLFDEFDKKHCKLENGLIKLAASLQYKNNQGDWNDSYAK